METLNQFVKRKRKEAHLTQPQLAERAGVGVRFIRDLEQNKKTLRLDKVEEVLRLFGHTLAPVRAERENYDED